MQHSEIIKRPDGTKYIIDVRLWCDTNTGFTWSFSVFKILPGKRKPEAKAAQGGSYGIRYGEPWETAHKIAAQDSDVTPAEIMNVAGKVMDKIIPKFNEILYTIK
jgi:hypothetical protein